MTRWLTDDEQLTWRRYLAGTRVLAEALERQMQRDAGIPLAYYLILAMLSEAPERQQTMGELARIVGASPSRLSHAVARLEEAGCITRERDPDNRRSTVARLTDAGMAAVVDAAPGHVDEVRRVLFDRLTPEQIDQLRNIFTAVLDSES